MIRVVLADDEALVRAGFRGLLDSVEDIEVVAEAPNGGEAVRLARELLPDLVVMDLRMPGVDGVTATGRISNDPRLAGVRVLVLTTFTDEDTVFAALRSGASGFLAKDAEPEDLIAAVRVVAAGDALLAPRVTRAVVARALFAEQSDPASRAEPLELALLTPREREVVRLVAMGMSNDEIAEQLVVSPLTAKTHVSRAMVKVGVRDRAQLVVFGYQHGLVEPGPYLSGSRDRQ